MDKNLDYYMSLPYRAEVLPDQEEGASFDLESFETKLERTLSQIEEGFRMLEDAKRCWISACLEDGLPVPEPVCAEDFSGQFKLRMPKSLHWRLAQRSREEGVSMNQYCVYLLSKGV